eukprot:TRINITY_DN31613_c0_g1_i1.p1 TRINITY_DN31613_c0_g1~~TRINITY_DN31613_c0_g1_i1.p1  ORF type:complete len:469 (+),score=104.50 TRINITY_DN31613_c0_g1_i1:130-1536(+)
MLATASYVPAWLSFLTVLCVLLLRMQAAAGLVVNASAETAAGAATAEAKLHRVRLQKQYVPIDKDGKVVAYKTAYFGQLFVGSPAAQSFKMVFDTGSGHIIVPSRTCRSETCLHHQRYDRSKSESAVDIEYDGTLIAADATERDQVTIAFGTGDVQGEFVQDVACINKEDDTSCVNLRIVLATEMTEDPFGLFAFDGVLGLSLASLSLDPHFNFFSQLASRHPAMSPEFGVFLAREDDGEHMVTFGGYDKSRATSELRWADVASPELGYWQVQIKRVRVGGAELDYCSDGTCSAILDTGTSLLGVPRTITRSLHRLLARSVPARMPQHESAVDCREVAGNDLEFDLGDHVVKLGVEDFSRPAPFNMSLPDQGGAAGWKLFCRSLLLPVDLEAVGPKVFIWGEPMLRKYYTVYDPKNKRVGFSEAAEMPASSKGLPVIGGPPVGSQISGAPMPPLPRRREGAAVPLTVI